MVTAIPRALPAPQVMIRQAPGLARALRRVHHGMRHNRPVQPWKLELFVTYSCGSRCRTCLIWSRYQRRPEDRARELDAAAFARIAASLGRRLRWISFTGGELTDRDDCAELVIGVLTAAPAARVVNASSHGLHPERVERLFETVARRFPGRALLVTLSLDGLGETYRKVRGVDGSDLVLESMDRLQALARRYPNLQPSFQTTISRHNIDQLDEILSVARARANGNVVSLANDSLVLTEGRIPKVDVRADPGIAQALARARRALPSTRIQGLFTQLFLRLSRAAGGGGKAPIPCSAGFASLTISPYGEVLQCDRHDEPLGCLQAPDYDLGAMIASEAFQRKLEPLAGCRECFTPCQAYPSMMQAPLLTILTALRAGAR